MPNVPFYANPPNDDGWKAFAVVLLPRKIDTSSLFNGAPGTGKIRTGGRTQSQIFCLGTSGKNPHPLGPCFYAISIKELEELEPFRWEKVATIRSGAASNDARNEMKISPFFPPSGLGKLKCNT